MRARVITGRNKGRIVVVVRRYFGEDLDGASWVETLFPWVVTSLGGPLRWVYHGTDEEGVPKMTIVLDDRNLEPLPDDGEDDTTERELVPVGTETVSARGAARTGELSLP